MAQERQKKTYACLRHEYVYDVSTVCLSKEYDTLRYNDSDVTRAHDVVARLDAAQRQNVLVSCVSRIPQARCIVMSTVRRCSRNRHAMPLLPLCQRSHLPHVDSNRQLVLECYPLAGGCWCEAGHDERAVTAAVESCYMVT